MTLIERIKKGEFKGGSGNQPSKRAGDSDVKDRQRELAALKSRIQTELFAQLDPSFSDNPPSDARTKIEALFNAIVDAIPAEENVVLSSLEKDQLLEAIAPVIVGFGPLAALMADNSVVEIMVNNPKEIFINLKGRMTSAEVSFDNEEHVLTVLNRVLEPLGEHIDAAHPIVKARFPDGTRLHAITRPIAQFGTTITIQKFSKFMLTIEDLIRFGSLPAEVAEFLRACVIARLNIVVSGDSGSGKTALLNVLSNFIPNDERIVTIEATPELQLRQKHVISLISRPPDAQEHGEITIRELVKNWLHMRSDRIVVGDCRSGEVIDLLQAMYTGHDGALTAVRSNDARDALRRLEVMCLMSGTAFPLHAIREMIASAINLIVHQERLRDGTRKIVKITEVQGIEGDVFTLSDIYEFEQTGIEAGKIKGRLRPTGVRPNFLKHIENYGIHLPTSIFEIDSNPPVDS